MHVMILLCKMVSQFRSVIGYFLVFFYLQSLSATSSEATTGSSVEPGEDRQLDEGVRVRHESERWVESADHESYVRRRIAPPRAPPQLLHHLLSAPEYLFELALTPMGLSAALIEHYALHERIPDLLQNDDGTIRLTPDFRVSVGQSFGAGATLSFRSLTRDEGKVAAGALVRVNADRQFDARLERRFSAIEGRRVALAGRVEVDRDREFFGIGNDTGFGDRRTIRDETIDTELTIDLRHRGAKRFTGEVHLGFRRQTLLPGEGPRAPPVGNDDEVEAPPGFLDDVDYGRAGLLLRLSSIDSTGRPTRGGLAELRSRVAVGLFGEPFSAWHNEFRLLHYLEILPRNRVLAFKLGANAVTALQSGDEIPLDELVHYGGDAILRGYRSDRFRDKIGYWGAVEYSFPVYQFGGLGFELAPTLFVDVGRVASNADDLLDGPLRYAGGVGVRASHDLFWAFSTSLGFSEDGVQFNLELGEAFF